MSHEIYRETQKKFHVQYVYIFFRKLSHFRDIYEIWKGATIP